MPLRSLRQIARTTVERSPTTFQEVTRLKINIDPHANNNMVKATIAIEERT